jgi:hypothetical protein
MMVGVIFEFDGSIQGVRILRDDVLDALYGDSSKSAKTLIESALSTYSSIAKATGIESISMSVMGIHPGPLRETEAMSVGDLLRIAALLYSSLANLDKLDELEESDIPLPEEINKRFSTEVRDIVQRIRPDMLAGFGKGGSLIDGGQIVKFGYFSPVAVVHFSVLHPARQSASVRDARARLWELASAMKIASIAKGAIITAVPRPDDATLGDRQRAQAKINEKEIEREADASNIRLFPVYTAESGAIKLVEFAS